MTSKNYIIRSLKRPEIIKVLVSMNYKLATLMEQRD